MAAYNLIATTTVGSGSASAITFTSIPQTYTDLKLVWSTRTTQTATSSAQYMAFNTLSTNFSFRRLRGTGTATDSYTEASSTLFGTAVGASATASVFSNGEIVIPNYAGSAYKSFSVDSAAEDNVAVSILVFFAGLWSNVAAINSISFTTDGNFVQYSTMSLYGIKNS